MRINIEITNKACMGRGYFSFVHLFVLDDHDCEDILLQMRTGLGFCLYWVYI